MKTVLNDVTLAATPAMKAASRPVTAMPSMPSGRYLPMSSGIALLYCRSALLPPRPLTVTSATRPGMIVSAGMKIFG